MPRPDVSHQRKAQIIQAAMAVFAREGFAQARVEQIAAEAGLSVGGVYWYFDSKEQIAEALMLHIFDTDLEQLEAAVAAGGSATERLLALAEAMIDEYERMLEMLPLSLEFYVRAAFDDRTQTAIGGYLDRYRAGIRALLEQGVEAGEFRAVAIEPVAVGLVALFDGLALHSLIGEVPLKATFLAHCHMILESLRYD